MNGRQIIAGMIGNQNYTIAVKNLKLLQKPHLEKNSILKQIHSAVATKTCVSAEAGIITTQGHSVILMAPKYLERVILFFCTLRSTSRHQGTRTLICW